MWTDDRLESREVPPCPGGIIHVIRAGDTLYALARRYGTTVAAIIRANRGIDPRNLQIGDRICITVAPAPVRCPDGTIPYTIRPGDTFFRLAQQFNVSVQAIIAANPGVDPNRLRVGQQICIPTRPGPPPPPPPPEITLPCCTVLPVVAPDIAEGAVGAVLISEFPPEREERAPRYALTFVATGLPDPETVGEFNRYIGMLTVTERPDEEPPPRFAAILEPSGPFEQSVTWCGTRVISQRPRPGDILEIRAGTAGR